MSTDTPDARSASERRSEWQAATEELKHRFDAEGVTEEDIEAAIEWARSE